MNRAIRDVALLAMIGLAACTAQPKKNAVPQSVGERKLVWNDEFDYKGLPDSTKWSYDTAGNEYGWGNHELQFYTDHRLRNASVSDGTLKITAIKENWEGREYTSARLITKRKGDWLYGRFEICAKLPAGLGTWPAIWMLPSDNAYGNWPASGEIDIMEHVGYDQNKIHGTVHTQAYNHSIGTQRGKQIVIPTVSTDFHVYAIEWDEEKIDFYVDDQLFNTFENENKTFAEWPFDKPHHLIMNLAFGGDWGGSQGINDSIMPVSLEIDYVRIYQ